MVSNYPTVRSSPQRKQTFACLRTTRNSKGKSKNLLKKTSSSKINYEKSKGLFIGRLKEKRPRLTNISWIFDNIKTLGIFHGYNIDTDDIWKNINQIKSCTHVWKTRNLTFKGTTLIARNILLAQMGFETEMRGVPPKYKKEANDLIWKFIWDNTPSKIDRNVCCLNINERGMGDDQHRQFK